MNFMKRDLDYVWPALGFVAVLVSFWLLDREFRARGSGRTTDSRACAPSRRTLTRSRSLATLVAYAALAWYDRIALMHLGVKHISWRFVAACSFTTYALSHNIGASVFSGAMVRYRAYSTKGLTPAQVAVLVALCSLTFLLGTILLGGLVLLLEPRALARLSGLLPAFADRCRPTAPIIGVGCLAFVALYVVGSILRLRPLRFGTFGWNIRGRTSSLRQMIAAPMELMGAAGIIYFALPEEGNPGFFVRAGRFSVSFSAALASNAPGGLGVFELVFIKAHADAPQEQGARRAAGVPAVLPADPARFRRLLSCCSKRRLAEAIEHHHELAEEKPRPTPDARPDE